ncbi:MAG: 30S ribosomal protein S17 [Candidatus Sungbacteria bacterium]|nr:30S ribosomal protein S17 [Candidatus Sungbacteria bacterium]
MPRRLKGIVVSDKMQKTVVVRVDRLMRHPKYLKYMKKSTKLKAHDEKNETKSGDHVLIRETRPMSKDKRWIVETVLKRALNEKTVVEES